MATVLIGADLCPIEGNLPFFISGDATSLFHDLLEDFATADLVVANLECPLIHHPSPILKTGPTFGESPQCLNGIKNAGIGLLTLANNHILDHGAPGLLSTLQACSQAGIPTVGAGPHLHAAQQPWIQQVGNIRLGVLAFAEHEFSIATPSSPGANPIDLIDFVRTVRQYQHLWDHLIVLLHGAAEFHAPTPRIQKTCRFMIECGARAVVVQHPHCLGGCESYLEGHIVYGQGALIMDEALYRNLPSFHEGFLVRLTLEPHGPSSIDRVPFIQSSPVPGARRLHGAEAERLLAHLDQRSRHILDPSLVEREWIAFCEKRRHGFVSSLLGHGGWLRRLNQRGWITRWLYGRRRLAGCRNLVCCQTHQEALQTLLDRDLT